MKGVGLEEEEEEAEDEDANASGRDLRDSDAGVASQSMISECSPEFWMKLSQSK